MLLNINDWQINLHQNTTKSIFNTLPNHIHLKNLKKIYTFQEDEFLIR